MLLFFIFVGTILISLIYAIFLFIYNYHLPDMKFCNDEYDVSKVTFKPRNLLKDISNNV